MIWGPYRINPSVDRADSNGRTYGPFPLATHEPFPVPLERSMPPSWDTGNWREQYEGEPVLRLVGKPTLRPR